MYGYDVSMQDNDSYAFHERPAINEDAPWYELNQTIAPDMSGATRTGARRCKHCGELLNKWDESLTGLRLVKRRYDISVTYDGVYIASKKFKDVCDEHSLSGLRFIPLPDDPAFYQILATEIVEYDAESPGTRFIKQCLICHRFESVVGATPVLLKNPNTIPTNGFVRTDLEFASGDEKSPLLLCGPNAGAVLKRSKLRGIDMTAF